MPLETSVKFLLPRLYLPIRSNVVEINGSQTTGGLTLLCVILGFKGR